MCFRYIFPCKEWIEVTKNVNSKYAKKLKVKDIEESMMSSLKSESLSTYSTHIVYLYFTLHISSSLCAKVLRGLCMNV